VSSEIYGNPNPQEDSVSNTLRFWLATCLAVAFIFIPWSNALAGERGHLSMTQYSRSLGDGKIWRSALALVPRESRLMRQVVASTNESKLLLGVIAGTVFVVGVAMLAYGSTSSCKGSQANATLTSHCDRIAVSGAIGAAGGTTLLAVWALSR
jgi:hypothetical protein